MGSNRLYKKKCSYCFNIIKYKHGEKPSTCPFCNSNNYIKTRTETILFELQHDYIKTKNDKYLSKMFLVLQNYSASIIKKLISGSFIYNKDWIDEKSSDAASLMIEYYLDKKDFFIKQSFAGYLNWKVKEVLYSKKLQKEEIHDSLNFKISEYEDIEMGQMKEVFNFKNFLTNNRNYNDYWIEENVKNDVYIGINKSLDTISKHLIDEFNYKNTYIFKFFICLLLVLQKKSERFMEKFYKTFGNKLRCNVDQYLLHLREELISE